MSRALVVLAALAGCTWDWDRFEGLAPAGPPGRWELTFREECDGTAVDRTRWSTQYVRGSNLSTFSRYSWAGSAASDDNVLVGEGVCRIRMENRPNGSAPYTTGVLDSGGKFEQTHGYFEARLKAARGVGLRTVFLMSSARTWPPQIDVARISGDDTTRTGHTVHYRDTENRNVAASHRGPDFARDFHVFGVHWTRDEIAFYVDGTRTAAMTRPAVTYVTAPLKFEITGHVAIEGSEPPDATTPWPAYIAIDWIRAWRAP